MLISRRFPIIGLQILILTHIAHSFVLLTANVEDVKKIARKFVSDSLAEKIADFIARATETMAQDTKDSEESENSAEVHESSQVSTENRIYNAERQGLDSQAVETKSKENVEKVTSKLPRKTSAEKKRHKIDEPNTHKTKKEPKPVHAKSRYIVQTEKEVLSEEDKYQKMKDSIKLIEDNLFSTADGKTKTKKHKKKNKARSYKLRSAFEDDVEKGSTSNRKGFNDEQRLRNLRASEEEKGMPLPTEAAATENEMHERKKNSDKAGNAYDGQEVKDEKHTKYVASNQPLGVTGKDELFDQDEKNIVEKTEKVNRDEEEKWWERGLPVHTLEVNTKGKSWF